MTGRSSLICICTLCALALGGLMAQTAGAATNGTTAFTCKKKPAPGGAGFSDSHCREGTATEGTYEHGPVGEGTTTETKWGGVEYGATIGFTSKTGLLLEIVSTDLLGVGSLTNTRDEKTGEHFSAGTVTLEYTGVKVSNNGLTGKGCVVKGGKIVTAKLAATTKAQGMAIKLSPFEGEKFASFEFEGCEIKGLNGPKSFIGSVIYTFNGATATTTMEESTLQKTLTFEGLYVGGDARIALGGRDPALGETTYTPLSFTTVETP